MQITIKKDSKKIGKLGIERLGFFSFINGNGKETTVKVYMNVNGIPVYDVLNTSNLNTTRFDELQNRYVGLRNIHEVEILKGLV